MILKEQPFYASAKAVKDRDTIKMIPNPGKKIIDLTEPKFYENFKDKSGFPNEYVFPPYKTEKNKAKPPKLTKKGFKATSNRPTKLIEPSLVKKRQRLTIHNPFWRILNDLSQQTNKKFVLDENLQANGFQSTIPNVINSTTLCKRNGHPSGIGVEDKLLLRYAMKDGYIIITQDKGLVFRSLQKNYPVVWKEFKYSLVYIDCVRMKLE